MFTQSEDYQLKFDQHNLCRKASQQLNVLKRLGSYLTKLNKLTIFHTFILSNFNFCPLAWHFCTEKNSKKLEKIQVRALRFVYDDYSSSSETLLENAKVPTLQVRRIRTMALETYKFYTIWLLYVYKIYSILKIQNIILDTEISWMYHR